jgi:hypothetical protein
MTRIALRLTLFLSFLPLASANEVVERLFAATYKVTSKSSNATVFFVEDPKPDAPENSVILVTAFHVLQRANSPTMTVVLRIPNHDGTYTRRDWKFDIMEGEKPLYTRYPKIDVAVMRLELPADSHVKPLPFNALFSEDDLKQSRVSVGDEVFAAGYPALVESNKSAFPLVRRGIIASYPLTPVKVNSWFRLDFDSAGGCSGGPVFFQKPDNTPGVIGVVYSENQKSQVIGFNEEKRKVYTTFSVSNAAHTDFVLKAIDLMDNTPAPEPDTPEKDIPTTEPETEKPEKQDTTDS